MPVLYIDGEHDPRQPVDYAKGMEKIVPGLEAILALDCGHFIPREKPIDVTISMMWFFHSLLGSGFPIFERSRYFGLPTKPFEEVENCGVNQVV